MAKTYEAYEAAELAKAKRQGDAYGAERKAQADSAVKISDGVYDAAVIQAKKDHVKSVKDTQQSYRTMYDANAVDELVARRQIDEVMANMGLDRSGLNATQQTAISLQRGRADSQVTQQKQAAVDAIMRELDSVIAQNNAQKIAAAQDIYAQADADIRSYRQSLDAAARQNAASLYKADRQAATEQAQLEWDKQQAAAEQHIKMLQQGYQFNSATGQYEYVGTEANRQATAELEQEKRRWEQELVVKLILAGYTEGQARRLVLG